MISCGTPRNDLVSLVPCWWLVQTMFKCMSGLTPQFVRRIHLPGPSNRLHHLRGSTAKGVYIDSLRNQPDQILSECHSRYHLANEIARNILYPEGEKQQSNSAVIIIAFIASCNAFTFNYGSIIFKFTSNHPNRLHPTDQFINIFCFQSSNVVKKFWFSWFVVALCILIKV